MLRPTQTDTSSIPPACAEFKRDIYGKQVLGEGGIRNQLQTTMDVLWNYINGGGLEADLRMVKDGSAEEKAQKTQALQYTKGSYAAHMWRMRSTNECLAAEIKNRDRLSFEIYQKQEQLNLDKENHEKIQSSVEAAQLRAQQASSPYEKTTAWESWIPLGGRPLEVNSIPILIGIACLFLVVALGLFLQMASVRLEIHSPLNSLGNLGGAGGFEFMSFLSIKNFLILGLTVAVILLSLKATNKI